MSQVQIYGPQERESCGYCKDGASSSYGIISEVMMSEDYQSMLEMGWRRCGTYYYKPTMHKTCCPAYTIRLEATRFEATKRQRKTDRQIKRLIESSTLEGCSSSGIMEVTTELASFTEEKYELYREYQMAIHGDAPDKLTPEGFTRFLIESSLVDKRPDLLPVPVSADAEAGAGLTQHMRWGTYHQTYRLCGKLVAVGVLDLLPQGASSVYCFYDPKEPKLSLGKYTALREIEWCIENGFKYYYMGFYIHSCPKMRYKGEYFPSELLCPTTYTWQPIEKCTPLLDKYAFSPLHPSLRAKRESIVPTVVASTDSDSETKVRARSALVKSLEPLFLPDMFKRGPMKEEDLKRLTVCRVPIGLEFRSSPSGEGKVVSVRALKSSSQEIVISKLNPWIDEVGPDLAARLVVVFN